MSADGLSVFSVPLIPNTLIPHRRIGADLYSPRLTAMPVGDRQPGPTGLRSCEHLLQRGTARSFLTRPPVLPQRTSQRGSYRAASNRKRELKLTAGVSLTCLSNSITAELTRPLRQALVALPPLLMIAFGGTQSREKR